MKSALNLLCSAVLLSFIANISIVRPANAEDAARWSVATVEGSAQVRHAAGGWQALAAGERIGVGDPIRTGKDGRVVLTRGDEHVTIGTDSSFEMQPASNGMLTHIFQKVGTLMFKVHKRPSKHFEVQTPYLVAAVKGTTFTVSVDAAGGAVHVVEGLVEVGGLSGDKVLVRPGRTASVDAKGGGKVQIGVTPHKPSATGGKQSKAPKIDHDKGAGLNIEHSSNGLFKGAENPAKTQMAKASEKASNASDKANNGNVLGQDSSSLAASLGNGLKLGLSNGNAGGNGNSNAGGNGNGNGNAGGSNVATFVPPGLANSNAGGNGKGKGKN